MSGVADQVGGIDPGVPLGGLESGLKSRRRARSSRRSPDPGRPPRPPGCHRRSCGHRVTAGSTRRGPSIPWTRRSGASRTSWSPRRGRRLRRAAAPRGTNQIAASGPGVSPRSGSSSPTGYSIGSEMPTVAAGAGSERLSSPSTRRAPMPVPTAPTTSRAVASARGPEAMGAFAARPELGRGCTSRGCVVGEVRQPVVQRVHGFLRSESLTHKYAMSEAFGGVQCRTRSRPASRPPRRTTVDRPAPGHESVTGRGHACGLNRSSQHFLRWSSKGVIVWVGR